MPKIRVILSDGETDADIGEIGEALPTMMEEMAKNFIAKHPALKRRQRRLMDQVLDQMQATKLPPDYCAGILLAVAESALSVLINRAKAPSETVH